MKNKIGILESQMEVMKAMARDSHFLLAVFIDKFNAIPMVT